MPIVEDTCIVYVRCRLVNVDIYVRKYLTPLKYIEVDFRFNHLAHSRLVQFTTVVCNRKFEGLFELR